MDELCSLDRSPRPGFRLHKLEVYNWGTFDSTRGNVYTMRPDGRTTLLIGQNGSGKSTLVDALLTLLVRPVVRNYNVAAGGHKQERDERTYIKGAFDRRSRDEDNRADVQYLRPAGSNYSVLLACFRNEDSDQSFTVIEVLYLNSEGRAEKIYGFSPGERSIAGDCAGLTSTDKIRRELEKRGFRATARYKDYHGWFAKATGVRQKAMDMFNQTVAVKDIHSLNRFIRDHMLEAKPWGEKVDNLLNHFTQLSEAHQSLLRVRRQFELLEPVEELGIEYRQLAERLLRTERLLSAADSFFRRQTVKLLRPECERKRRELVHVHRLKEQLGRQIGEVQEEGRRLTNEIEHAGGDRLRQIPLLIDKHKAQAETKRDAHGRYEAALGRAAIDEAVADAEAFAAVRGRLPDLIRRSERRIADGEARREELVVERSEVRRALTDEEHELKALESRQGNLPEALAELRRRLCEDLRLPENDLPFAAELVAVDPSEQDWEASIEMVLRNFALSLLVPERHYHAVSRYVERTQLADARGRGQRLVYLRVGSRRETDTQRVLHPGSLLRKLQLREGHPLLPWIKAELEQRLDYRCCDTLEAFQQVNGLALTRQRHVKGSSVRHEKDDRRRVADPRNFVLGWDNRQKRIRLAQSIARLRSRHDELDQQIQQLLRELEQLRERLAAACEAHLVTDFSQLDYAVHEREIDDVRREQHKLEDQSDTIRLLKQKLARIQTRHQALQASRDDCVGTHRELTTSITDAERLIANAEATLQERKSDGTLAEHSQSFAELDACFADEPLTVDRLVEQERQFTQARRAQTDRLRKQVDPLKTELGKIMNRFLREFPDERADLEAQVDYLDSFLDMREHIRREDLPRHIQRFKERLNEKVIQEIGLLNGTLYTDRAEIVSKIELLNQSLRQLAYRPGTFMKLEPRPVRDREINEFQDLLRECLAGTFDGTSKTDEARFQRIEMLIRRFREEPRWRDKVTDVRRWFDFVARELDESSGEERGYYEDSAGQSGGEKAKLAFTILVAAIAYQYDIDPVGPTSDRFHFVVVDEMFSKVDDQYAEYALELFRKFGLQLLIVSPLDAKARVTEPYVGCYLHVVKDVRTSHSEIFSMTAHEFEAALDAAGGSDAWAGSAASADRPRAAR